MNIKQYLDRLAKAMPEVSVSSYGGGWVALYEDEKEYRRLYSMGDEWLVWAFFGPIATKLEVSPWGVYDASLGMKEPVPALEALIMAVCEAAEVRSKRESNKSSG
jgi:hypothetical protein